MYLDNSYSTSQLRQTLFEFILFILRGRSINGLKYTRNESSFHIFSTRLECRFTSSQLVPSVVFTSSPLVSSVFFHSSNLTAAVVDRGLLAGAVQNDTVILGDSD